MLTVIAVGLALGQATPVAPGDAVLARMTALFDRICVKAFPGDDAVAAMMTNLGAVPMTPEQVKSYLHANPGRGWVIVDGDGKFTVTVEAPPFHACGVRRSTPDGFADLAPYRAVVDPYERAGGGFAAISHATSRSARSAHT